MDAGEQLKIGRVVEVHGERAVAELAVDPAQSRGGVYPGQLGTYVKIPFEDHAAVGVVSASRILPGRPLLDTAHETTRTQLDCLLVGTLKPGGEFLRGVARYPIVGQDILLVSPEEVRQIMSEYRGFGYSFGSPSQAEEERAFLHVDTLFGHHVAVLGSTGCGKSYTVASMLQAAIRAHPHSHIVVLDLHGEYANAFPNDANVVEATRFYLPYWLLDFDEFQSLTVDMDEDSAKNQILVLRDSVARARQTTDRQERLGLGASVTADSPIYYDIKELLGQLRNWNIQVITDTEGKLVPGPLNGVFDRFLIRFDSRLNDPRYDFMFGQKEYTGAEALPELIRQYLSIESGKRITIVDLSGIPSETVAAVISVLSRMVFEFNVWNEQHNQFPILMVYEEAHNYLTSRDDPRTATVKAAVERIAKEGRKYGVGIVVVSQRPMELSETILAQCSTFIAMRLTNPDDQEYVKRLVPDALSGLVDMLPSLRTGEAMILGESVVFPTRVMVDMPDPRPRSEQVQYSRWWRDGLPGLDVDKVVERWRSRGRDVLKPEDKIPGKPPA